MQVRFLMDLRQKFLLAAFVIVLASLSAALTFVSSGAYVVAGMSLCGACALVVPRAVQDRQSRKEVIPATLLVAATSAATLLLGRLALYFVVSTKCVCPDDCTDMTNASVAGALGWSIWSVSVRHVIRIFGRVRWPESILFFGTGPAVVSLTRASIFAAGEGDQVVSWTQSIASTAYGFWFTLVLGFLGIVIARAGPKRTDSQGGDSALEQ
jgi:hypothetical protein